MPELPSSPSAPDCPECQRPLSYNGWLNRWECNDHAEQWTGEALAQVRGYRDGSATVTESRRVLEGQPHKTDCTPSKSVRSEKQPKGNR